MLRRIDLRRFRGFHHFEAPVEGVTAFLGPNSSGKTSVLQAVRLACDLLKLAIDSPYPPRVEREPHGERRWIVVTRDTILSPSALLPLASWQAHFLDQEVGAGVMFVIGLEFDEADSVQGLGVVVSCAQNQQLKLEVTVRSAQALDLIQGLSPRSPLLNQRLTALLRADAPVAVLVPPFYGTVLAEEYRSRVVIDRLLGSGDQSHVVRNLVAALEPEQFTRLNTFLREVLGEPKLSYRTSGDALQTESPLVVRFQDTNGEIELSAAGAGLVNLVALFCALSRWRSEARERPVLFLLDEPEAHLSPKVQADASARIGQLVTAEFGAQLLLATHSVDILNRLAEQGATLIRCDRAASPSAVVLGDDASLFEDLRTWADLTPYTAINFLASRKVLFCEGDDDKATLNRLAELRYRNDPARLKRFRQWAIVQLKGASNASQTQLLARLVRSQAVQTQAQHGGFSVFLVLDRDHGRTPGTRADQVDGVAETTVVWSRHSLESVLLEVPTLCALVRARVGVAAPEHLEATVEEVLREVGRDETLNVAATDQLAMQLFRGDLLDADGRPLGGDQKFQQALRRARAQVAEHPEVWQRGKDRAQRVLGALRARIALPARNQFPTSLVRLLTSTDVNQVTHAAQAIPAEIGALLDQLSATPGT